jgi:class 3 adenylate cyclase
MLFIDVSGFTALNEKLAQLGAGEGAEQVTKHINSYFGQLMKEVHSFGGDVLKFAGYLFNNQKNILFIHHYLLFISFLNIT